MATTTSFLNGDPFTSDDDVGTKITKTHWKSKGKVKNCCNATCKKALGLLTRARHCRMCGEVFCKACVTCRRRLNQAAQPDVLGKLYKVCKNCFEKEPQSIGCVRKWTDIFNEIRSVSVASRVDVEDGDVLISNLRDRMNWTKELKRLQEGFTNSVGSFSPSIQKSLLDFTSMVKKPDWQQSTYFVLGKMTTGCYICSKEFSFPTVRHACSICGVSVCGEKKCSNKDVIVYQPDKHESAGNLALGVGVTVEPSLPSKLAVIKIIGCPAKEPRLSLYLRTCKLCRDRLENEQVAAYQLMDGTKPAKSPAEEWLDNVQTVNLEFVQLEEKISSELDVYSSLIDSMESAQALVPSGANSKSNIQVLAKAQGDLSDHFSKYSTQIGRLKQVQTSTQRQKVFKNNLLQAKCEFYHDNIVVFRKNKNMLEKSTPEEVLGLIQGIVNRNAITSCYISVKQVALELLICHEKYQLDPGPVHQVANVEDTIAQEFKQFLVVKGERWEPTETAVNQVLKLQLKDHKLFRLSERRLKKRGITYVQEYLSSRTEELLQQVETQLKDKTVDKVFPHSKTSLKQILANFKVQGLSVSCLN